MPNLTYDPQNPHDLLGQPVAAGDIVAWGTTYGRSAALCVGRIEKINFFQDTNSYPARQKCSQDVADSYTLKIAAIKTTGSCTMYRMDTGEALSFGASSEIPRHELTVKAVTVQLVANIVKLDGVPHALANRLETGQ